GKIIVRETDITTRGKTFQVICIAEDEDLVGWFDKQDNKITSEKIFEPKYYIQKYGKYMQALYVVNVKVADGGNYTCKGSKNSKNFELYVEFYVTEFPSSIKMNATQKAIIPCSGVGYPKPIYRWYRNWQRTEIFNSHRYRIMSNGSLLISNVTVEDASNYTCRIIQLQETNRPREERKHIEVIVYGPPRLDTTKSTMRSIYSYKGNKRFEITCRWWGFPVPKMNITRPNGRGLLKDKRISARTIYGNVLTEEDDDFGEYFCGANNFMGSRKHKIVIKEADKPLSPSNVSTSTHCGYITVFWKAPSFDGGLPITLYEIELLRGGVLMDDATTGSRRRRYTFNGGVVKPATRYSVRVRGRNHAKEGLWATLGVTSDFCPPHGKIEITNRKTVLNSTSFTLTWTGPPDNGGDPSMKYNIEYSKQDEDGKYVHWTTIKGVRDKHHNITGLEGGNKYMFHVAAVNKMGRSDPGKKEFEVADSVVTPTPPPATAFKLGDVDLIYDIQVNCTSMAIQIDLTLQKFPHLDLESFRLRDPSCIPYEKSTNHVILRTRLDACGTTNKHRNESVTYYNSVTARVVQSKSRMYIVEFPFSCTFIKRRTIGTPSFQLRKRVFVVEEGFGNFSFEMNLFKSSLYKNAFDVSEYPVKIPITKELFAQTKLLATDKNLEALTYTCIATPSANPHDQLQYSFIENGCVIDSTVKFKPVPGVTQEFQMLPFKFRNTRNSIVYLHCHVMVCHKDDVESRCRKGCIPKIRTSRETKVSRRSSIHRVTLGPINVQPGSKTEMLKAAKETGLSLGVLLVTVFATLVACFVLFTALTYGIRHAIVTQHRNDLAQKIPETEPLEMANVS
ncbi:hypothetical protein QZH41_012035, partial [Actinostola sp. cb2023]